jgi:hypothetical protein
MMPHCAPAAAAYDLANNKPRLYAGIIASLYRNAFANLPGSGKLVASHGLRTADPSEFFGVRSRYSSKPEADWILLSSIRNSESWGNIYWGTSGKLGWLSGMTFPSTLERWLRDFGYTKTINETNLVINKSVKDLHKASDLLESEWRVFLFLNAQVLKTKTQAEKSRVPDHYVTLTSRVNFEAVSSSGRLAALRGMISGPDVRISFVCATWGRSQRVPEDERSPLSGFDFCKNFYGYVAAKH